MKWVSILWNSNNIPKGHTQRGILHNDVFHSVFYLSEVCFYSFSKILKINNACVTACDYRDKSDVIFNLIFLKEYKTVYLKWSHCYFKKFEFKKHIKTLTMGMYGCWDINYLFCIFP